MTSGQQPRTISSLSQGESENGLSRIYGGIHFSFDNIQADQRVILDGSYRKCES